MSILRKTSDFLRLIKFSHSVFALPFAFTGALIAAKGIPSLRHIIWITVAMVGARTVAMGLNRIIDSKIDALNPRTKDREIPKGIIKKSEAFFYTLLALAVFILAAYKLNPLCLMLSPMAVFVVALYPYAKRFTSLSHLILGLALSFAPFGAWVAIKGSLDTAILPLSFAVMFWVAGFDIFYAMQDMEFDRRHTLFSIPSRFGIKNSIRLAKFFHLITILLLLSLIPIFNMRGFYLAGVLIAAALLVYEHMLVKPDDLSRIDMAFFNMNGYISITLFLFTLMDCLFPFNIL
ncbi:MAG: UbiA family prenyltransferase [Nitrospirae bacterium]|nr:UbiA family prenyltransferase [Nitrospirota bacterium]